MAGELNFTLERNQRIFRISTKLRTSSMMHEIQNWKVSESTKKIASFSSVHLRKMSANKDPPDLANQKRWLSDLWTRDIFLLGRVLKTGEKGPTREFEAKIWKQHFFSLIYFSRVKTCTNLPNKRIKLTIFTNPAKIDRTKTSYFCPKSLLGQTSECPHFKQTDALVLGQENWAFFMKKNKSMPAILDDMHFNLKTKQTFVE